MDDITVTMWAYWGKWFEVEPIEDSLFGLNPPPVPAIADADKDE